MKSFICKRLRLFTYLTEKGFTPTEVLPDSQNPKFNVFLFDETPELTAAVVQYLTTDCTTARKRNERNNNYVNIKEKQPQNI